MFRTLVSKNLKLSKNAFRPLSQHIAPQKGVIFSHCSYCGSHFHEANFPRKCHSCHQETFRNPIPVAVGMIPIIVDPSKYTNKKFLNLEIDGENISCGIVLAKRAIQPYVGGYCMPGGFNEWGASWQETISKEVREELCIETSPEQFVNVATRSTPDNTRVLIFGLSTQIMRVVDLSAFSANSEVSDYLIGDSSSKLCFSIHQNVYDAFFNGDFIHREQINIA